MDDTCVTISGRPDVLSAFSEDAPKGTTVYKTSLDTLYHASVHVGATREEVLADVLRRDIQFPRYEDIIVPIRSTHTGKAMTKDVSGCLLEDILDMLLVQRVNWNIVTEQVVKSLPASKTICLVNIGPGTGIAQGIKKALPRDRASVADQSVFMDQGGIHDSIAIIGMAVNMPGSPDVAQLWKVLEQGINTIGEVIFPYL